MSKLLQMSHRDYLAYDAYGSTQIRHMADSFAYFDFRRKNPEPSGRPLVVGSAFHTVVQAEAERNKALLGDILTYKDGSSGTAGFRKFQAENPLKYCVDEKEHAMITRMSEAVFNSESAMEYIKDAEAEPSIIENFPNTHTRGKARIDYLHRKKRVTVNLKSAQEATEAHFFSATKERLYDFQSVWHTDLVGAALGDRWDEVHILVKKEEEAGAPVPILIRSFGDDTIQWARSQIYEIMARLPECERTGVWPKASERLVVADTPLWARKVVLL